MKRSMLLFVLVFMNSCVVSKPNWRDNLESTGNYKVSVTTDGEEVGDFSTNLIHHINVRPKQLEITQSKWFNTENIESVTEYTAAKEVIGFRLVVYRSEVAEVLGLKQGDLITAVGKVLGEDIADMRALFRDLNTTGKATLTMQRDGKPHKMLYYLR